MAITRQSITLCLIRCGQTVWDADGRVQGATDLPLSEAGRAAVNARLHALAPARPAVIHHPADEAAAETAALCARRTGARTKAVVELADPHLGLLEGLTQQEFAERFPKRFKQWDEDPLSVSPPEGEEIITAANRLFKAIARILRRSRSHEIGIVMHDMGLGLVRCWLADRPLNDLRAALVDRPLFERYDLPVELLGALEKAAQAALASA